MHLVPTLPPEELKRIVLAAGRTLADSMHALSGPEAGLRGLHQKLRETLRNRNPEAFDKELGDEFDEFDYDCSLLVRRTILRSP
jgi:hypothetical protein